MPRVAQRIPPAADAAWEDPALAAAIAIEEAGAVPAERAIAAIRNATGASRCMSLQALAAAELAGLVHCDASHVWRVANPIK